MNYIWLKTNKKYQDKILIKCFKNKINIYETKENKEWLYLKILDKDYNKIKKIIFVKFTIIDQTGIPKLKKIIKKYHIFLISIIIGLIIFFFLTHIMVKVTVIHSNKDIRQLVMNALEEQGIKKNTWKKSYQEIEQIKEKIINQYPNNIEWLEIEVKGMNYIVRVEERKIVEQPKEKNRCHIIAKKDGMIKKIIYSKGEALVKVNDYIKKGDILITGSLKKDEKIEGEVCAKGSVYAEVWYNVIVKLPKQEIKKIATNKKRWNLKINNNLVFKNKINNYTLEEYLSINIFNITFSIVKQNEVEDKTITYTNEELEKEAIKQMEDKFNQTLKEKEQITDYKILSKEDNKDSITLKIFVIALEQIGEEQEFNSELEKNFENY